jgi:hypothetical protein
MRKFTEFVDKKARETKKELGILKHVLGGAGLQVSDHVEDESPYLFVKANTQDLSFEGVRIYKIGSDLAFRVQKQEDTHPYGSAYSLSVETMFNDLLADEMDEEKAGKHVMEAVAKELNKFFEKSGKAEKELRASDIIDGKDPLNRIVVKTTGTDYALQVSSKTY